MPHQQASEFIPAIENFVTHDSLVCLQVEIPHFQFVQRRDGNISGTIGVVNCRTIHNVPGSIPNGQGIGN